jgi:hypothetical protein
MASPRFDFAVRYLGKNVDDLGTEASGEDGGEMFTMLGNENIKGIPGAKAEDSDTVRVARMVKVEARDYRRLNIA